MITLEDSYLNDLLELVKTGFDNNLCVKFIKVEEKDSEGFTSFKGDICPSDTEYQYKFLIEKQFRETGWWNKIDVSYYKLHVDITDKPEKRGQYRSEDYKYESLDYRNTIDKNTTIAEIWSLFEKEHKKREETRLELEAKIKEKEKKEKNERVDKFFQDVKKGIKKDSARDLKLDKILND